MNRPLAQLLLMMTRGLGFIALCVLLSACQPNSYILEPEILYVPQKRLVECTPSAFERLSPKEIRQEWGKELHIANVFATDFDFYRAITSYKRALIFIPADKTERRMQIQYGIILCYYLGQKYQDAVETFEASDLTCVTQAFPAYKDLMIILFDSYQKTNQPEKAEGIFPLIEEFNAETSKNLMLSTVIGEGDLGCIEALAPDYPIYPQIYSFLGDYRRDAKSVRKAQTLNAILPGAGYLYVGQKNTAITAFLVNALFIAAAYEFFSHGYPAAGIITSSLEFGWYAGGINGAGLAAKEINERLYEGRAKEFMMRNRLFPVLMLETTF
jgi:tetratricopeptide (TPR) repeat protein